MSLQGTLAQQDPLKITEKPQELGSFKEHWRWANCHRALGLQGLYEGPGSLFWVSMARPIWEGSPLPATEITYGQLAAGRLLFSDEKLKRSAEEAEKRHYFINTAIPTAVGSLVDVPKEAGVGFPNLPCFGTRSLIAGFYSQMDDALRACGAFKIRRLYEAASHFLCGCAWARPANRCAWTALPTLKMFEPPRPQLPIPSSTRRKRS